MRIEFKLKDRFEFFEMTHGMFYRLQGNFLKAP